jgi:hypothetical protein
MLGVFVRFTFVDELVILVFLDGGYRVVVRVSFADVSAGRG